MWDGEAEAECEVTCGNVQIVRKGGAISDGCPSTHTGCEVGYFGVVGNVMDNALWEVTNSSEWMIRRCHLERP